MASKQKPGIKYFSQDSNHVLNTKVRLIFIEFDSHGPWVWECLKCEIYSKKGYYFDINNQDELMIFASDVCKKPVSLVKEIINSCIRRELFDRSVFDAWGVLTSDRIQNNYLDGTRETRKKNYGIDLFVEFLLIEIGENEKSITLKSVKNPQYRETVEKYRESLNNSRENADKVDKSKEDESKLNNFYVRDTVFEDSILNFFGIGLLQHHEKHAEYLNECCAAQFYAGHLDYFQKQCLDYQEYIALIGSSFRTNFYKFFGSQKEKFEDGTWQSENWAQKTLDRSGVPKKESASTRKPVQMD